MRFTILFLLTFFINLSARCQVTGVVRNQTTGQPIPYAPVWLQNEDKGTTTDAAGNFILHLPATAQKNLLVEAIGFGKKIVPLTNGNLTIDLEPLHLHPPAPVSQNRKNKKEAVVGNFHRWDIQENFYGNAGVPYVLARLYPYDTLYRTTPYLKELTLLTWSKVPAAKFRVRLFRARTNGTPGEDLSPVNIIGTAGKGQNFTTIDLKPYHLDFPETGLFVGVEWLILEENQEILEKKTASGKKKVTGYSYEPQIGVSDEPGYERWMLIRDTWRRSGTQSKKVNTKLQFKLVLTD
jgi:hypothetical protein